MELQFHDHHHHFALFYVLLWFSLVSFSAGISSKDEMPSEVGVVGQRATYSNGTIRSEEDFYGSDPSPPLIKPACRESVRPGKPAKGQPAASRQSALISPYLLIII